MKKIARMKKVFILTLLSFAGISLNSQVIYSDNFNQDILNINSADGYTPTLSNNNAVITADGSTGEFVPFVYDLHSNGSPTSINFASSPKLYIKVRGTNSPDLRIDVQDDEDYVSNLSTESFVLTNGFSIYVFDYTGRLEDGGYGGSPCTSTTAPCDVDPTKINRIQFFVNASTGGYNGTLEIDWISFGASLEDLPDPSNIDIRYNQVGYLIGRDKTISLAAPESFGGQDFSVYDNSGNKVLDGTTGSSSSWNDANEHVAHADVSDINTEGTYRFVLETDQSEISFKVSADGYAELREEAFKYYYYNRASTALEAAHAGPYARATGIPDNKVRIHSSATSPGRPENFEISAPKGWYDAGDYGKYIVNSGISTYTLLAAFEHYKDEFVDLQYNIPERGGNLPDILDEVLWNLDWMLDMQDPHDGGVYHKLTAKGFSGRDVAPAQYNLQRYVVQKSTAAALNFAAVTAVASRIFKDYESVRPGFSAELEEAAKDAYSWAKANPTVYYNQNSPGSPVSDIRTGEYGDGNVTDEFQWAAVELFITTGENTYKNDINVNSIGGGTPSWPYSDPLALISIAQHRNSLNGEIDVTRATNTLLGTADQLKNRVNGSAMKITMQGNDYAWGSNGAVGNQLLLLIRAYELTDDSSYLDAAYTGMDYLLGRNGTGFSYVTGFGDKTPIEPHHRISEADNVNAPVPGMLVGGPQNENNPDTGDCSGSNVSYPSNAAATKYVDHWCSYSTNEITINWNAPFVYALHALYFYQKDANVLSTDTFEQGKESFALYPNPANKVVNIKLASSISKYSIEVYNISGKQILSKELTSNQSIISLGDIPTGLYLAKVNTGNEIITKKFMKN